MNISSINPVNGKVVRVYEADSERQKELKIEAVHQTWLTYKKTSFKEREDLLAKLSALLLQRKHDLAKLMADEMGKPLKDGVAEIEKCASVCDYYRQNGRKFLENQPVTTETGKSYISFQPIGVVLAIMPWNFPFWQVFRFLAPALMAGNAAVLKHASNVTGCALAIEKLVKDAGFPVDIFEVLICNSKSISNVIKNPSIQAVTLTGSTQAGMQVAKQAGAALKKTVLELGGSDPYIVLKDADLELAAKICAAARLNNNGQTCIAAKRFIVVKEVFADFVALLKKEMEAKVMGDPYDELTDLGPMARIDLRDELHEQVLKSIKQGASCILGGVLPNGHEDSAFYAPTILTGVKKGNIAYSEELFGPVACVIEVKDETEAIVVANDTDFGLGAAIFSKDVKRAELLAANELQAGSCFVNEAVKSDPKLPFGGTKHSGYGRELAAFGMYEFVNVKTVRIAD